MEMALSLGPKVFINQSRALQDKEQINKTTYTSSMNMPVLIMCGSEDKLCSIEKHEIDA